MAAVGIGVAGVVGRRVALMARHGKDRQGRRVAVWRVKACYGSFWQANVTGKKLKELRRGFNLSVPQAARQVEVSARTWARWESGKQTIPDGAVKLLKLLNRNLEVS
jgi:DNA-binding transcriptional regulator YiaG